MDEPLCRFPDDFLWGAATQCHQVEGGNRRNDWWRFEHRSPRHRPEPPERRRVPSLRALRSRTSPSPRRTGTTPIACRSSGAASSPSAGKIDAAAVAHYHEVLASLEARGLLPDRHAAPLHAAAVDRRTPAAGRIARHHRALRRLRALLRPRVRRRGRLVVHDQRARGATRSAAGRRASGRPTRRDDGLALEVIANQLEAHGLALPQVLHARGSRSTPTATATPCASGSPSTSRSSSRCARGHRSTGCAPVSRTACSTRPCSRRP